MLRRWSVAYLLTQSRNEIASCEDRYAKTTMGTLPRRRENLITRLDVYARTSYMHVRAICACVYNISLLTCQPYVHWVGARDVTVWTIPLTWSESPLIIRPFAKFSLLLPLHHPPCLIPVYVMHANTVCVHIRW